LSNETSGDFLNKRYNVKAYLEVLVDLLDIHAQDIILLDPCSVEEDDFDIFALREAVKLLQYIGDGGQVREIDADSVDLDIGRAFGYEWSVFVFETLSVAAEKDDVVNAFGSEFSSGMLWNWSV
jgi:hypothetical protein